MTMSLQRVLARIQDIKEAEESHPQLSRSMTNKLLVIAAASEEFEWENDNDMTPGTTIAKTIVFELLRTK